MAHRRPRLLLAWRDLREHRGRHLLSIAGVALAVAVVLGAAGSQGSLAAGIEAARQAAVGRAEVVAQPVGGRDARVDPEVVTALAGLPQVRSAAGVSAFAVRVAPVGRPLPPFDDEATSLVAADDVAPGGALDGVRLLRGRLIETPGEVLLSEGEAERLGAEPGSDVHLAATAEASARVAGVIAEEGVGAGSGGRVVVARTELARRLDSDRPGYRSVRVVLDEGVDAAAWLAAHERALPPGAALVRADDVVSQVEALSGTVTIGLDVLSVVTMLMGALLCFHVNQIAAVAARRSVGLLRAVGATRSDVLVTTGVAAGLSAAIGVAAGVVLGRFMGSAVNPRLARFLGVTPTAAPLPARAYVLAAVAALVLTAAALLAGRVWRVVPLDALLRTDDPAPHRPATLVASSAALVGTVVVLVLADRRPALLAPGALGLLAAAVWTARNTLVWWGSRPGRGGRLGDRPVRVLGARSIARDAGLVGVSLGLVMATFAVILAAAVTHGAVGATVDRLIERQAGGDVQLYGRQALPPDATERLQTVPGVEAVTLAGFGAAEARDRAGRAHRLPVLAVDEATYFAVAGLDWTTEATASQEALVAGRGVALSSPLAAVLGVDVGDRVPVTGARGATEVTVVGVFRSITGAGAVASTRLADGRLGILGRHTAFLRVAPGRIDEVSRALAVRFPDAEMSRTDGLRERARRELLSLFGIGYSSLLLAAGLCTVGLGLSMSASVIRREREFRVLRSLGTSRSQVVRMLLFETTAMVVAGFVAALPVGWVLSRVLLALFNRQLNAEIPLELPVGFLLAYPLAVIPLAAAATVLPARRAASVSLV